MTVVILLWRFSALTFTGHNNFVCDSKVYFDNSKKINYALNRLRAMPLANFTPNQFYVVLSSSKGAREPQPNNYIIYTFDQGKGHKLNLFNAVVTSHVTQG